MRAGWGCGGVDNNDDSGGGGGGGGYDDDDDDDDDAYNYSNACPATTVTNIQQKRIAAPAASALPFHCISVCCVL